MYEGLKIVKSKPESIICFSALYFEIKYPNDVLADTIRKIIFLT